MESVIFENSPVAQYLEGQGESEVTGWMKAGSKQSSPTCTPSFAPQGLPIAPKIMRRRPPRLKTLDSAPTRGTLAHFHSNFSSVIHSRLGWTENTHFLEQFRYLIVASQLLNEHSNPKSYQRQKAPLPNTDGVLQWQAEQSFVPSTQGLALTGSSAFALAWVIRWFHYQILTKHSFTTLLPFLATIGITIALSYYCFRRQWLHYLRAQAIAGASSLTSNAQDFDVAVSAGITLIQEVELVSRGYNISNPLPPISRLEDSNQQRRCVRLRRTIHRSLIALFAPYYDAYHALKPLAEALDLEKYCDVYEISRTDIEDVDLVAHIQISEIEDADTLQDLKVGLQKLHIVRKLLLCTLLALDANGSKLDFLRWTKATETMNQVSSLTAKMMSDVDEGLGGEEDFQTPPTPKLPLTPSRERVRSQMRQLGNLSQGVRSLQAKMRLLRDDSDKAMGLSDECSAPTTNLLAQYDSIGVDLKELVREWEQGRAALATNLDKKGHQRSISSPYGARAVSPTLSLGGTTAGGGSPKDALQALNGNPELLRSRSSTTASSSGDELFEAVALPRQRSTLTREERIAKMKEERVIQAIARENSQANTHMLKELETVIKLRPRGRTTGRMTTV